LPNLFVSFFFSALALAVRAALRHVRAERALCMHRYDVENYLNKLLLDFGYEVPVCVCMCTRAACVRPLSLLACVALLLCLGFCFLSLFVAFCFFFLFLSFLFMISQFSSSSYSSSLSSSTLPLIQVP
jgi:hypothetical protein